MAEIVLFHHAQGLTSGVLAFADELRSAGHTVHVPDLYEGKTFDDLDEGVAHARELGEAVMERGRLFVEALSNEIVYAGMSLGGMPAQMLAQTRPGAKGLLLLHTAIPLDEFGGSWPAGVPLQIHTMEDDDWGDVDVARELEAAIASAELFVYPGDVHLFTDNSLPAYDEGVATLVKQRVLSFLADIDSSG
jgi:dienelactone hydrolase